jgi:hypothetical protein
MMMDTTLANGVSVANKQPVIARPPKVVNDPPPKEPGNQSVTLHDCYIVYIIVMNARSKPNGSCTQLQLLTIVN